MADNYHNRYFLHIAGSYIRNKLQLPHISDNEAITIALQQKIPHLYRFKIHSLVPRIKAIIDIVATINVNTILDVASQRGALLFPLLDRLHTTCTVTSIDIDPDVIEFLKLTSADIDHFNVVLADITNLKKYDPHLFLDNSYECIVCSEILEHLENPLLAATEMVRVSSNYIICSVPALPDNNEEHIQLFYDTKQHPLTSVTRPYKQTNLKQLWLDAGAKSCKVRIINEPPYSILLAIIRC